ncbi:hypothetical protein AAFF_G00413360 [Aldrovandia affinis]|uniref:Uncharacterized protein n=1 Tax=Aldrovandia affinis TaxID=143900 RepID=A0AAD7WJN8_9TELE|nr:hypothetical protein AAFF_G00413360 [Aldrovandia affinis]
MSMHHSSALYFWVARFSSPASPSQSGSTIQESRVSVQAPLHTQRTRFAARSKPRGSDGLRCERLWRREGHGAAQRQLRLWKVPPCPRREARSRTRSLPPSPRV